MLARGTKSTMSRGLTGKFRYQALLVSDRRATVLLRLVFGTAFPPRIGPFISAVLGAANLVDLVRID